MKKNNRSHFKIKALNKEKILNNLSKDFLLFNIKQTDRYIEFDSNKEDGEKIETILLKNNVKELSVKHKGFKLKTLLKMWGVIVGLILGLCAYCFQYFFVFKIEVWGCENLSDKELISFVENQLNSKFRYFINTKEIEIAVKNNFEKISSVSIAIVGQSLIVSINEAVLPDEMEGEFSPIISQYDGLVTDINLVQGTCNVQVGDIVQKGDVLVYPYIYDADGEQMAVQPKAQIQADVWIKSEDVFYEYLIKEERTGRKIVCSEVSLFNLIIYSNTKENSFDNYESEVESYYLTKNNILPFIYTKYTFYETKTFEINRNFEEEKDEVIEKLRAKSLISLSENEIIKDEKCSINNAGGIYYLSYTITIEKDIGEGYGYQFPQS